MFQDHMKKLLQELLEEKKEGKAPISIPSDIGSQYTLEIDDEEITLIDQAPGISLYAEIDKIGQNNASDISESSEKLYTTLLRANFMGQATRGASLGLSEDGNRVILSHLIPVIENYKQFRDVVEDFTNAVCFWKKELS